ncbi:MAG TPA: magnesium transporter CorA family protein [Gammaproteobacteria bacterium]|nr:magnesium transporter CorA family protein [Gammaproteobacteria bacterium]
MINAYINEHGRLRRIDELRPELEQELERIVWVDLLDPTEDEESLLEHAVGINLPTREEMEEIELSSRLYVEEGAAFMTAQLPAQADRDDPEMAPVTFVLTGDQLVTIRYHDPRAFKTFVQRAFKVPLRATSGFGALIALLEVIVDRLADVLERVGRDVEGLSRGIFQINGDFPRKNRDFQEWLEAIGRKGDLNSKIRDSLLTLERLGGFLRQVKTQGSDDPDLRARLSTLARDIQSLTDHASFLSQKITFLLDATLGMINIEQNNIIKIFSVAAVVFLPPTLIASIFGMNFKHMPPVNWAGGYPLALGLMVASAALPLLFFKWRRWL